MGQPTSRTTVRTDRYTAVQTFEWQGLVPRKDTVIYGIRVYRVQALHHYTDVSALTTGTQFFQLPLGFLYGAFLPCPLLPLFGLGFVQPFLAFSGTMAFPRFLSLKCQTPVTADFLPDSLFICRVLVI